MTTPTSSDSGDRITFGPSANNIEVLEKLESTGIFKSQLGAFQAAALLAIAKGLDVSTAPQSAGTKWNRGSVKPQVLDFLRWYLPTEQPVRNFETLGNLGTEYIGEMVRVGGYTFAELFELSESEWPSSDVT